MRAAVIGATGFVGRALVRVLARRAEVVAGADVAYYLVHSLGSRNFSRLDRRAAENVAAEADRAGVSQIVWIRRLLPFPLTGFCDAGRRALDPVTAGPARGRRLGVAPRRGAQFGARFVPTRSRGDRRDRS